MHDDSAAAAPTAPVPDALGLIAGRGVYPLLLAQSARSQGVRRIVAFAFRGETERAIESLADEVRWLHLGQLQALLDAVRKSGVRHAVMAGQLTPTALFQVRFDSAALGMLRRLKTRNAESIFGAAAGLLKDGGVDLLPAHRFMESHMARPGRLSSRGPTAEERADIDLGFRVAAATSALDIGQTVVVKEGTILAVEAFEGTNEAIERAARLGGPGIVVVKRAKPGHDMRFDIPVVGLHTLKVLRRAKAAALAVEAGRTLVLEREAVAREADRMNLCLIARHGEGGDE